MSRDRTQRFQQLLGEAGLDAALFYKPINTYYLTGFTSLDSTRPTSYTRPIAGVVDRRGATLVLPELVLEAARPLCWIDDLRAYRGTPAFEEAQKLLAERIKEAGLENGAIGIEEDYLPVRTLADLRRRLPGARFENAAGLVERLRLVKDAAEINNLREAARMSDVAMAAGFRAAVEGVSELAAQARGNYALFSEYGGAEGAIVDTLPIILGGPRGSMPHEFTSNRVFQRGDVMWHCWLVSYRGYWIENVRTGVVEKADGRQRAIAAAAEEALARGREQVRPGNEVWRVYDAVARVEQAAQVEGALIFNRSGHGTGLEYHEPPFCERTDQTVLQPGMVVTVEPGIWLPGYGGFTLSDTLVVTETGHEVLTAHPVQLFELEALNAGR